MLLEIHKFYALPVSQNGNMKPLHQIYQSQNNVDYYSENGEDVNIYLRGRCKMLRRVTLLCSRGFILRWRLSLGTGVRDREIPNTGG